VLLRRIDCLHEGLAHLAEVPSYAKDAYAIISLGGSTGIDYITQSEYELLTEIMEAEGEAVSLETMRELRLSRQDGTNASAPRPELTERRLKYIYNLSAAGFSLEESLDILDLPRDYRYLEDATEAYRTGRVAGRVE
jgi:hypothetical protein